MKIFSLRLTFTFAVFAVRIAQHTAHTRAQRFLARHVRHLAPQRWQYDKTLSEFNEMKQRIQVPKLYTCIFLLWLGCTIYMFQNGGIVAGIYMLVLGVSPVLVLVWLVTHKPKEG